MRRLTFALAALVATLALSLSSAFAGTDSATAPAADPGVSKTSIKLGGTFPLSGPASAYGTIPRGIEAYFKWVNNRRGPDGKRGIYGRRIEWKYYDDGYNPANAVQLTRQLVEQDKVFALFAPLGTEVNQAIRPYLNQRKVPQMLVSTGASYWGVEYKRFPYTNGWQPDYVAEARLYGRWIRANRPTARIGLFFQNDDYGKDYIRGLEQGLGNRRNQIVERQGFEITQTDFRSHISALRGANLDVVAILATPTPTVRFLATARAFNWKPGLYILNSVSATDNIMTAVVSRTGNEYVNGTISTGYLKDVAAPGFRRDPVGRQYINIMRKYGPANANLADEFYFYGMAKSYDMVRLLYMAGRNPTRASLLRAYTRMNWRNPFALPGIRIKTSATDRFPISQQRLMRWNNGNWVYFGRLQTGR